MEIPIIIISLVVIILIWTYFKYQSVQTVRNQKKNEQLKSEFVTVVTHKFRTPITRIKWATSMLHDNTTFQSKEDLLKDVERAVEQITGIIDLLTDFSSLAAKKANQYDPVSLRQIITASIEQHAQATREKQMTFDIRINSDVPSLRLDKNKIQFVIDVMIENALKYGPQGSQIIVGLLRDGSNVIFSVTDAGIGIASANLDLVFQGFWRSEEAKRIDTEGIGLSLRTARALVESQDGKMWAESPGLGQGASFFVMLPIKGYDFKFK